MSIKEETKAAETAAKTTRKPSDGDSALPHTPSDSAKSAPKAPASAARRAPRIREKKAEAVQKLRIRIRAYEHKILDASVKQIIDTAARFDAKVLGPVPLPTEKRKYTVNRSSFVYKNAREQFEMRVHKRLIDIINPNAKLIEALTNMSLPSGVNIDAKIL